MFSSATSTTCRLIPTGRVWLCDDDLGLSRVPSYALHQDRCGHLWIGSERGPVLFDGLAWETPAGLTPLGACIVCGFAAAPTAPCGLPPTTRVWPASTWTRPPTASLLA